MPKLPYRKRLSTKKNRPKYGSKKNKENCPIEIPSTTLLNATSSCSALASTKQQNEVTGSCPAQVLLENCLSPPPTSPPVSPVTPKSFQDHDTSRCSALASTKKNNEVNCAHPAPVSLENCWSPPPASPPVSPVTPKGSHELFDCLISPTTGVLRSRNNISFCADDFAEGTVVHSTSTPLKGLQSGINYEWCTASFSAEACGEESSFPDATPCSGDLSFGQPTPNLEKTDSRVFTVSSMSIIDATPTPSGIYPRPLQEKVQVSNIGPSPSLSQNPVLTVEDLLKTQLPTCWQVNTNENKTAIICRMQASPDSWANIQRCAYISEDGTVQLDVHCQAMSLDHQIWQDLPCRVGLTNRESVDEFVKYVLEVVNVFRSYVMCIGIPESKYSKLAAKHSGLMFDGNLFKEARYAETYRSKTCLMLLPTKTTTTKFCSSCSAIRGPLLRRFSRAKDPLQTPPTKANHRWLDSTQKTRRLAKLSKAICNSKKREDYHRAKAADLIERFGVHVEERNSGDFRDILDKHYKSMKITEENKLQRIFIEQQLKAGRVNGPRGMKWHPAMIRLALQIHMMAPAAYEAIAGTGFIRLPSSRTLYNYSHISDVQQGINGRALKEVVDKLKKYPWDHFSRYFMLLMDEMYISKNLVYSRATGELSGFVHMDKVDQEVAALELQMDMDDGLNPYAKNESSAAALRRQHRKEVETFGGVIPDISSTVLAFMAVGVANGIKQVVASYGCKGTSPASLSFKTWDVVSVLERNHVHVLGLVCDGHATNRKFIKMHEPLTKLKSGTVFDTRNRAYPLRPFYFFSDVPHLLKTLRNNFYNSGMGRKSKWLKKDGETISWKTIVDLYESEKDNEVRLAYKLNAQVVFLNSYSQMKVSYATRVFSKTVANAITEVFKHDPKPVTVDFITKVNDFFDCLNGASLLHGIHKRNPNLNPYRRQYKKNKEGASIIKEDVRFKMLKDFSEYLLEWKKSAEDERFHISDETIVGVEMTVHSFIACVNFMLDKGARYILARVFCQDPLEQHFGKHRGACGGNRNPNLKTYQRNENKFVILKGLPFKRRGGNTKVVRAEGWADRVCAPLLKRAKSQARVGRVNIVRKKLLPNAALNK